MRKLVDVSKIHCLSWEIVKGGIMIKAVEGYYLMTFEDKKIEGIFKAILIPGSELFPGSDKENY